MNKIFTLLTGLLVCTLTYAQKPEAEFTRLTDTAPILDGVIDAVWDGATQYNIDRDYTGETPSVGNSYWKAMYADSGIFVLINVDDDVHVPWAIQQGGDEWTYDKTEIYFDVNDGNLQDGKGSSAGAGHFQFAPSLTNDNMGAGMIDVGNYKFAVTVTDPSYVMEFYIPFATLIDENGFVMSQFAEFGFDVYVIDRDVNGAEGSRQRRVWSNIGTVNENYANMDDAGLATLLDPSDFVYVDEIALSASATTIDVNNGTVQLTASITPENATVKDLMWVVNPADAVKVSKTGLVTAVRNGTVTIYASSTDGGYIDSDPVEITISNQILSFDEANLIVNGNFDNGLDSWGGWVDAESGETYVVEDGVVKCVTAAKAENWHYQFNQTNMFKAIPEIPYVLKFKSWATKFRVATVDFEDTEANGYNRYGASSSPGNVNGRSEWQFDLTTDPTWYEFEVTFDQIVATTAEKVQFLLSIDDGTVYIDSVALISKADLEIIGEEPTAVKRVNATEFSVYPNPVGASETLMVDIMGKNSRVAIFNAVGQKVAETVSVNNRAVFNVSSLQNGLYIIRLEDGSAQKFIR